MLQLFLRQLLYETFSKWKVAIKKLKEVSDDILSTFETVVIIKRHDSQCENFGIFFVTQILREINLGDVMNSKTAVFGF